MRERREQSEIWTEEKKDFLFDELSSQDDNDDNVDYTQEMGEMMSDIGAVGERNEIRLATVVCNLKQFTLKTGNNFEVARGRVTRVSLLEGWNWNFICEFPGFFAVKNL